MNQYAIHLCTYIQTNTSLELATLTKIQSKTPGFNEATGINQTEKQAFFKIILFILKRASHSLEYPDNKRKIYKIGTLTLTHAVLKTLYRYHRALVEGIHDSTTQIATKGFLSDLGCI